MLKSKKEKLYISTLIDEPTISYPGYYILSPYLAKDEMLQESLIAIHSLDFSNFYTPKDYHEIFKALDCGIYPIFKQKYLVGQFGGKLMYLEPNGWKAMPLMIDSFVIENWLVA
jgi:hypothetical protein